MNNEGVPLMHNLKCIMRSDDRRTGRSKTAAPIGVAFIIHFTL